MIDFNIMTSLLNGNIFIDLQKENLHERWKRYLTIMTDFNFL